MMDPGYQVPGNREVVETERYTAREGLKTWGRNVPRGTIYKSVRRKDLGRMRDEEGRWYYLARYGYAALPGKW
jgi:hypothetical protein